MPLHKFHELPDSDDRKPVLPRPVTDHDGYVASPVHALHGELLAFADTSPTHDIKLYPGWFRLTFPLVASGGLWAMALAAIRHFG